MVDGRSPHSLAFIVCDSIIEDRETGKKTLVGVFNRINARRFPATHSALSVFLSLTEGRGCYEAQLQCVRSAADESFFEVKGPIEFESPTAVVELGFHIRGLTFQEPGPYEFRLLCDGELVTSRPFEVIQAGDRR